MDYLDKIIELLSPEEIKILLKAENEGILKLSDSGRLKVCEEDWSNDPEFLDYLKRRFWECSDCKERNDCETALNNGCWLSYNGIKTVKYEDIKEIPNIIGCTTAVPDRFSLIRWRVNIFKPDEWEEEDYKKLLPIIVKTYERQD